MTATTTTETIYVPGNDVITITLKQNQFHWKAGRKLTCRRITKAPRQPTPMIMRNRAHGLFDASISFGRVSVARGFPNHYEFSQPGFMHVVPCDNVDLYEVELTPAERRAAQAKAKREAQMLELSAAKFARLAKSHSNEGNEAYELFWAMLDKAVRHGRLGDEDRIAHLWPLVKEVCAEIDKTAQPRPALAKAA